MRFGPVPIDAAVGQILGHNVSDASGRRALRKGRPLTVDDIERLRELGKRAVYVARLEPGDVPEDEAAERLAAGLAGPGLRCTEARTGRVNFHAERLGVLRVDAGRLRAINGAPGIALATLRGDGAVRADAIAATLKIVPFAIPGAIVGALEESLETAGPILTLDPILPSRVGAILSGTPAAEPRIRRGYLTALGQRLRSLGASLVTTDYVPLENEEDEARLAAAVTSQLAEGVDLIVLAGETAIQDAEDIAPRAIVRAGGEIAAFGAPVDPGNLLLLAFHGTVPILGAPGCARSPKPNIVDLVLPRLLAGERMDAAALIALGHGGLLEDVAERAAPRTI